MNDEEGVGTPLPPLPAEPANPLRILHLEDSPCDAEIVRERLGDSGLSMQLDWASDEREFTDFLRCGGYDLILADYELPGFDAPAALRLAKSLCPGVPFICVSGAIGEERAVELLRHGATDYVLKGRLEKLPLALRRALNEVGEHNTRKQAEEALRENAARQRDILFSMADWVWEVDEKGVYTYCSQKGLDIFGISREAFIGKTPFDFMPPDEAERVAAIFSEIAAQKAPITDLENWNITKKGERICLLTNGVPILDQEGNLKGYRGVDKDITERKQVLEEKAGLEAQLQQAQKMESLGRLAGGVAHDFNNMLAVILGYTEMALDKVDPEQPLHADLLEVCKAATHSADLIRQLLAFARKQTVMPRVLDLNDTVTGMLSMLQRLIGEDIKLNWHPDASLWQVIMDPSQIDQILANLCINARDAIADVGKLTIETTNQVCDEFYCACRPDFAPGEYVLLVVSDTGCGMDRELQSRIFEPFFTTKEMGKGTGLGLATLYGIVKQNNGHINVYSEVGQGTVFTIYLPRHAGKAGKARPETAPATPQRGHETILLVEDEPVLLRLITAKLQDLGYTVLAAAIPDEAFRLAGQHGTEIGLLMTDVIMPDMNGRDLAKNFLSNYPHIKRLFMSGYTADVIGRHGVLEEGTHFIQKPFSVKDLAAKVREVLDSDGVLAPAD